MLTASAMKPSAFGSNLLNRIRGLFSATTYGHVRYVVGAGLELIHTSTNLTFQQNPGEAEDVFLARVYAEVHEGDMVEFRVKNGKVWAAEVTRHAKLPPIAQLDVRDWDEFMTRYREYRDRPRA